MKSTDILDVWFDSGTTHYTVMRGSHKDILGWPADLYLEGSDQHRGWFHSSLLTGTMLDGRPPYNQLLTHGFCVDEKGEKMSKSKGNVVRPQEINDKYGAEILRLWVASTDYSGELRLGPTIINRVVESYRRIRNTLRFLLANTSDFSMEKDAVPVEDMLELDRWAVAYAADFQKRVLVEYGSYRFHNVVTLLQTFASTDLGASTSTYSKTASIRPAPRVLPADPRRPRSISSRRCSCVLSLRSSPSQPKKPSSSSRRMPMKRSLRKRSSSSPK